MKRKTKTYLLVGGLGVVGLLLYEKMTGASILPAIGNNVNPGNNSGYVYGPSGVTTPGGDYIPFA